MAYTDIGDPVHKFYNHDAIDFAIKMPNGFFDLTLTSPPYEDARLHSGTLSGEAWVDWATTLFMELHRITAGATIFVVEGRTRNFEYSCAPMKLAADLSRAGIKMRKPLVYHRIGIPGSGGPDWFRNDWEFVLCATHGKLPWSDQKAIGHAPVAKSGKFTHRKTDGTRVDRPPPKPYTANHGNIFHGKVGKGQMGSDFAHQNTAPYPEWLCDPLIRSLCPPDGIVLDPMGGSGTTIAVAAKLGRKWTYNDVDETQCRLAAARLSAIPH